MKNIINELSKLLHKVFVINSSAAAIQQRDGRYITKYFPFTPFVIEAMLKERGAIGCYQQSYNTGYVKWICFDFDCKDKENPDIIELNDKYLKIFLEILNSYQISYLTEFSGRRGIHVWLVFEDSMSKSLAYQIANKLYNLFIKNVDDEFLKKYGIDLFPATESAKGNKVGKQVKLPLSSHKLGGQSFFFKDCLNFNNIYDSDFYNNQYTILVEYKLNNVVFVSAQLSISSETEIDREIKFKKINILSNISCSSEEVISILGELIVYSEIFQRLKLGLSYERDWYVILGTIAPIDNKGSILQGIFMNSPMYSPEKSISMIEKFRDQYYPITLGYLYSIYDLDIEEGIDKTITGLEYLLEKLSPENLKWMEFIQSNNWIVTENQILSDVNYTIEKERKYILYNDENVDIEIWNGINSIKRYDIRKINEEINKILTLGLMVDKEIQVKTYKRIESEDKTRLLVSLGVTQRIITTHVALLLASKLSKKINSFSYNIIAYSKNDIFYNWYTSWKNYISHIRSFFDVPFLASWGVMVVDVKKFYDCIDFLAVYDLYEKELGEEERRIFKYLISLNDLVMRKTTSTRIGVPQGPAYARIIAEMFLSSILRFVSELNDKENCRMYRYVDDIVIFYTSQIDGGNLFNKIKSHLKEYGLDINVSKSRDFGQIKDISTEDVNSILKANTFNYHLQLTEQNMVLSDKQKITIFKDVLNNEFSINSVGYIFGQRTDDFFAKMYFNKFKSKIFSSIIGRGSVFCSFYRFLFSNPMYLHQALEEGMFQLININSLNFKNCVSQLYLAIQNGEICDIEIIMDKFINKLNLDSLDRDELTTVESIKMWRKNNG